MSVYDNIVQHLDFPWLLVNLTIITGLLYLIDVLWWAPKRQTQAITKPPILVDFSRNFFIVFLLVLIFRSFLFSPFRIPTGSLEPTIIPGDFIWTNHYSYGLRVPVWQYKILPLGKPKPGDIMLFDWPVNPKVDLIKRVIGVPGDKISYIDKVFYRNGKPLSQAFVKTAMDEEGPSSNIPVNQYEETVSSKLKHMIYRNPQQPAENFYNLVIPKGYYFVSGDNRDDSDDSRYWGLVPDSLVIGRASLLWLSYDSRHSKFRWHRLGWVH